MKIYQCIHKYPPHIPAFEKRWGIGDHSTFAEIHKAVLQDGYASVYRLVPSTNRPDDEVFFVIWDYDRLQITWARENGLESSDLDEIRLLQIERFKPDVVYDFSSFISPNFSVKLREGYKGHAVCWNGYLKEREPPTSVAYDGYVSLHRPFVESWNSRGFPAIELQPGIDPTWLDVTTPPSSERNSDLIAYGQVGRHFAGRADLVSNVAESAAKLGFKFKCHAQYSKIYYRPWGRLARYGISIPFMTKWPNKLLERYLSSPLYGIELYEGVRQAKAVLNNFTDLSAGFHSNMRIFETIGNGTPLLTPKGTYPVGLEDGIDYLSYKNVDDISQHMIRILADPEMADAHAKLAKTRMAENFSKERQYNLFAEFVSKDL